MKTLLALMVVAALALSPAIADWVAFMLPDWVEALSAFVLLVVLPVVGMVAVGRK